MAAAENLVLGVQTLLLGMAVTFFGLVLLQIIVRLMTRLTGNANPKSVTPAMPATAPAVSGGATNADEEIAAIAAVMALLVAEGSQPARIGAVRQLGTAPSGNAWGLAGRQEIMASRKRRV